MHNDAIRQESYSFYSLIMLLFLAAVVPLVAFFMTMLTSDFLVSIGWFEAIRIYDEDAEVFSRIFLVWVLTGFAAIAIFKGKTPGSIFKSRWFLVIVILLVLGMLFSIADPFHRVRAEGNWIRYFTAAVLVSAGLLALGQLTNTNIPVLTRIVGLGFGVLFIAAASDELFEFHESASKLASSFLPKVENISPGDSITLLVAIAGAVGMLVVFLLWRLVPQIRMLVQKKSHKKAFLFLVSGVLIFLYAMCLDTFDALMSKATMDARISLVKLIGYQQPPIWIEPRVVTSASNSLEEMYEYLAAIFFLIAVATLFSIERLAGPVCLEVQEDERGR